MKKRELLVLTISLFIVLGITQILNSAPLMVENFDFSGYLDENGWTQHSGSTDRIDTTTGLTYTDYVCSGIGNAALVDGTSQDVNKTFSAVSSGTVFSTFMVNVSSAGTSYYFHFASDPWSYAYRARMFCNSDGTGDFEFGLSFSGGSADGLTNNDYSFNTTYLVTVKYVFIDGENNDEVSLYVSTSGVPTTEPVTPTLGPFTSTAGDISNVGAVALRQSSSTPHIIIDGIRVATNWEDATLPVELSSFTAEYTINQTGQKYVSVNWTTASETDVIGFNIYRNIGETYGPSDIINSDIIKGNGTTTQMHTYSFKDEEADVYTSYYYWLEVVNLGGISDIHGPIEYKSIDIDGNGELNIITGNFNPCFPNPVQLGDEINFKFMVGGLEGNTKHVELKVYNVLGELVREIVNEDRMIDEYTETWTPRNLPPGVYLYQLKTENFNEVKKLVIIR
ncbi:MAG: T9SS type A sorting domain-containing protein [Candidatus Cloacimonetes bacterium]|nr:T9SS type A sorting domain-containing protein [Candidatus Cloacimonadota bacterium]